MVDIINDEYNKIIEALWKCYKFNTERGPILGNLTRVLFSVLEKIEDF